MDCRSYNSLLDALHDGELDAHKARAVRQHLQGCWACKAELQAIQTVSRAIRWRGGASRISTVELARLHRNLRLPSERELMELAGLLATLAASLLIVSSAWLANFPTRHVTVVSPAAVALPAWERTAITLQSDYPTTDQQNTLADCDRFESMPNWLLGRLAPN